MALIKCEACGHQVSERAGKCPKCGYLINKEKTDKVHNQDTVKENIYTKDKQNTPNKKRTLLIAIAIMICLAVLIRVFVPKTESKNKQTSETEFVVDKVLYECDEFKLSCETIKKDGIEFECKNNTNEELSLHLVVSLDGVITPLWNSSDESTIKANETKTFMEFGTLESTEHKYMSVDGTVFLEDDSVSFEICNLELDGEENISSVPDGECIYVTENLKVDFVEANAQGLKFKVENKREKSITFGADSITINDGTEDYAMTVTTIPPRSIGFYNVDILSYNESYYSSDFNSFKGVFAANINGEGVVDRFDANYPVEVEDNADELNRDDSEIETSDTNDKTGTSQITKKITARKAKQVAEEILEDDLGKTVKITELYFNEGLQGCYVEFKVSNEKDAAAVHLDTGVVDYKSEFDYYSERATELRKQTPINESELHKCNQAILSSSYADWNFTVSVLEKEDSNSNNGWEKIK